MYAGFDLLSKTVCSQGNIENVSKVAVFLAAKFSTSCRHQLACVEKKWNGRQKLSARE